MENGSSSQRTPLMQQQRSVGYGAVQSNHESAAAEAEAEAKPAGEVKVEYKYRSYSLPTMRFTNLIRTILFIDGILAIILWTVAGTKYVEDSVLHFDILQSVFDIAVISVVRLLVLFILFSRLEDNTMKQFQDRYNHSLRQRIKILHASVIIISLGCFSYNVVKGSLILNAMLNDSSYTLMPATCNALVVSGICFGLLEFICACTSFCFMRKLRVFRIMHKYNELYQELDEEGKVKKQSVNLARLIGLAKPEMGMMGIAFLAMLVNTASTTAAPLFFGKVVDAALRSMAELNRTVLILLGIYTAGSIAGMFRAWLFNLAGQKLVARIRKELFSHIIVQDIAFFDTNRTGELTNRLASDTQVIQNAVTVNVSMLARNVLQILGSIVFMFVLNVKLTGVLLAVVPIISIGAVQYGKFVRDMRKNFQDRLADASTTAEECLSSIRTVRSFSGEERSQAEYAVNIDKSYQVGKKLALAQGAFDGLIGTVVQGAIALLLWYGGKLVHDGDLSPGILTSFLLYTLNVAFAFALLSSLYGDFMQAVGASVRIFDLLDKKPDVPCVGGLELVNIDGDIRFENVSFTYPSRPDTKVIKNISFDVKPGEMVALVGPSGGGKSTIVSLIERFYDPEEGRILIADTDIKTLNPVWYRNQMSLVSQEPTLFASSIKDNISYGKFTSTEEEVIKVAKEANAHDFIMEFEEKYDTLVGERGVRLSGGQKQRVAIGRALIMNPKVLLLDEATSALDAESEHLVQEAIDRAMVNRTVLVIAHRLSTVRNASKVIVIDKGEIAEQGTHEELLEKGGVYKKLVLRQLMAGRTNPEDLEGSSSNDDNHQTVAADTPAAGSDLPLVEVAGLPSPSQRQLRRATSISGSEG